MGWPLLIGQKYDRKVQEYVVALQEAGTPVNTIVVRSAGTAVLKRRDPGMLGGSVVLTKVWAHYLLQRMGYVKTTKVKNTVEDFDAVKKQFLV